jgi:hypothetical protein
VAAMTPERKRFFSSRLFNHHAPQHGQRSSELNVQSKDLER